MNSHSSFSYVEGFATKSTQSSGYSKNPTSSYHNSNRPKDRVHIAASALSIVHKAARLHSIIHIRSNRSASKEMQDMTFHQKENQLSQSPPAVIQPASEIPRSAPFTIPQIPLKQTNIDKQLGQACDLMREQVGRIFINYGSNESASSTCSTIGLSARVQGHRDPMLPTRSGQQTIPPSTRSDLITIIARGPSLLNSCSNQHFRYSLYSAKKGFTTSCASIAALKFAANDTLHQQQDQPSYRHLLSNISTWRNPPQQIP
ncbi:hypothetical protein Nepgr_015863 [Nepenthes gracilis]|uniref:Uncharacterized protein n=1 Tax=Nepenthes gracilis TaxID=150966 RepID=A0AAD3XQR3_NEPGR|nr:hypothetical protein Nepgr_015863 [Nepenthes gracilis]